VKLALEISANAFNTLSIVLAGRNSVHTWWTGIVGCLLFGWLFLTAKLYADVTLQAFFIVTSLDGFRRWRRGAEGTLLVSRTRVWTLLWLAALGSLVAAMYGFLLHRFTDAYAPFLDSLILTFSALGQLLLVQRRIETWGCWLLVNTLAVPIYFVRGLELTSLLYACYWVNAIVSLWHWRSELVNQKRMALEAATS
jgi:nicotinamide mononucleotide transporter